LRSGVRRRLCRSRLRPVYSYRHAADADNYAHEHRDKDLDANPHSDEYCYPNTHANPDEHADTNHHADSDDHTDANKHAHTE
jgi:hypothetical protein